MDAGKDFQNPVDHIEHVGVGSDLNRNEDGRLTIESRIQIVIFGPQHHSSQILQAYDGAAALFDDQLPELLDRMYAGAGAKIETHHLTLGGAHRGEIVVIGERGAHVLRREPECRKPVGIEPRAQCELPAARNFRQLHALHRVELRLDHARHVVSDLIGRQYTA